MRPPDGPELSFLGTVATFGFAGEVTTSELSIESLFPADEATARGAYFVSLPGLLVDLRHHAVLLVEELA